MKRLRSWLGYLGWGAALLFFAYSLRQLLLQEDWVTVFQNLRWNNFGLALLLLLIGLFFRSLSGYVAFRALAYPLSLKDSYRFWFLSQLSKYIPGGFWQFTTRSSLYREAGMPLALASALSFWEMASILLAGIAIILLAGSSVVDNQALWLLGGLLLLGLVILSQMRRFWRLFANIKLGKTMLESIESVKERRLWVNLALFLLSFTGWCFINLGFHFVVLALVEGQEIALSQTFFIYTLAWTIGFLVVIAPAGFGPREAVLIAYYLPLLGEPLAILIALVARLWWTLVEALHIAISLALSAAQRKNPSPE